MAVYNNEYLSNDKDVILYNTKTNILDDGKGNEFNSINNNIFSNNICSSFSNNNTITMNLDSVIFTHNNKNYKASKLISTCNFLLNEKIKEWLQLYCNIYGPSKIIIEYTNLDFD
jgi:hypothetical protein